jgi:hypothetical protein
MILFNPPRTPTVVPSAEHAFTPEVSGSWCAFREWAKVELVGGMPTSWSGFHVFSISPGGFKPDFQTAFDLFLSVMSQQGSCDQTSICSIGLIAFTED